MGYTTRLPTRRGVPTVLVRLATDEGEVVFRARWQKRAIDLQRRILYRLREGMPLWFEDERGESVCFRPEHVWRAMVAEGAMGDGR